MKKYFGTDGIRGRSNSGVITPETMIKLARATSLACDFLGKKSTIIIGNDTRASCCMLESSLTSGFVSMGVDVMLTEPMPTPAISMLVKNLQADLGIMISASHNPYYDNGVKFFQSSGYKISSELEEKIEELMDTDLSDHLAESHELGKITKLEGGQDRYIEYVKHSFLPDLKLDGIKLVIDCANGAAYDIAPKVFDQLGAEVITCGVNPTGFNINHKCGVMNPQLLIEKLLEHKADLGIALDGDADRVLIIDETGQAISGDQIIAALAWYLQKNNLLKNNLVVTTILSNMGLELYLKTIGIELLRTNVGDKHVVEKMLDSGCNLGGEQSGHIIIGSDQPTGDGIKSALAVLAMYKQEKNISINKMLNKFTPVAQFTENINYDHKHDSKFLSLQGEKIEEINKLYQEQYDKTARIIIRQSGTEPIIRVMVESLNSNLAKNLLTEIKHKIEIEMLP